MADVADERWETRHHPFAIWRVVRLPDGVTLWVGGVATTTEEQARVAAAAPELLKALIGVVRVADRKTDEFDAARAAIAKATEPPAST